MDTTSPLRPQRWRRDPGAPGWRQRRITRLALRAAQALVALVVAGAAAFGVLMLVTPSVGNARQIAQSVAQAHDAPYPGPVVPAKFAAALEATEDHRFNSEPGVDPIALGRFLFGQLTGQGDQGGATLYAQLAKMLYTPGNSSLGAQLEQVALAVKLRYSYSGPEILRLYAGVVYFGHGYYGLANASCGYFGVPPGLLSWPQSALLAGLVRDPTLDDPLAHPANGRAREEHVMGRLVAVGRLTSGQAARYLAIPLSTLLAHAGGCRP